MMHIMQVDTACRIDNARPAESIKNDNVISERITKSLQISEDAVILFISS